MSVAPQGFHYYGDPAKPLPNNKWTKRIRRTAGTKATTYQDIITVIGTDANPNSQFYCTICECIREMSGNWSNALRHIKKLHPTELAEGDRATLINTQSNPASATTSLTSTKGSSLGSAVTIAQALDPEYIARKKQKREEAQRIMPILVETIIAGNLFIKCLGTKRISANVSIVIQALFLCS